MVMMIVADCRVSIFALCRMIFQYLLYFIFSNIKKFSLLLPSRYLVVKYFHDNIDKNYAKTKK